MSFSLFLKAAIIWFILAAFAIGNAIFRESFLEPYLGEVIALPVSGITLSLIIFTITYFSFDRFGKNRNLDYLYIGIQWITMTLIFEFIFGHYVIGKSWSELLHVFNILDGNLFIIVLLVSLFSPLVVSHLKK